jgi:putative oxidoreductase
MMSHGYHKLTHFSEMQDKFMNFLGMGGTLSLALVVFAEFFCALFIILGLFTRLSTIPLIICMAVAFFKAHHAELKDGELSLFFLAGFVLIALVGPGKISVDGFSGK